MTFNTSELLALSSARMNRLAKMGLTIDKGKSRIRFSQDGDTATIDIMGPIFPFALFEDETSPNGVIDQLNETDASNLLIRVNSPGGEVFAGVAIYNILRQHKARKTFDIIGEAASIATVVTMAGDEIRISEAASYMVHDPWSIVAGNSRDHRKESDILDGIQGQILSVYKRRTDQAEGDLKAWMEEESWWNGTQAVELGFADKILEDVSDGGQMNFARSPGVGGSAPPPSDLCRAQFEAVTKGIKLL